MKVGKLGSFKSVNVEKVKDLQKFWKSVEWEREVKSYEGCGCVELSGCGSCRGKVRISIVK